MHPASRGPQFPHCKSSTSLLKPRSRIWRRNCGNSRDRCRLKKLRLHRVRGTPIQRLRSLRWIVCFLEAGKLLVNFLKFILRILVCNTFIPSAQIGGLRFLCNLISLFYVCAHNSWNTFFLAQIGIHKVQCEFLWDF